MRKIELNRRDLYRRYKSGQSENFLSNHFNVCRNVIRRYLREGHINIRSQIEANRLMMSKRTPEENAKNTIAAHAAIKGTRHSEEHCIKHAQTVERMVLHTSVNEDVAYGLLVARGFTVTRQKAIGRYNVDLAVHEGTIAVEICGGGYSLATLRRTRKRLDYIINSGWCPILIYVPREYPLESGAIEHIITTSHTLSSGKSIDRREHVILGNGNPSSVYSSQVDYNASVGGDKCGAIIRGQNGRFTH